MPELPDVAVYVEALRARISGERLEDARVRNLFFLRTVDPSLAAVAGRRVTRVLRIGKRIVIGFEGELCLAIHLMIAGRLRWEPPPPRAARRQDLAWFRFTSGTLAVTEAGTKRRASLHVLAGENALRSLDRGGLEVEEASLVAFTSALTAENHTLKRALTDPRLFSGIGNAYSDEILHRARLSPLRLTRRLDPEETARLHDAARAVLSEWTERLREDAGGGFPTRVTAFRAGMSVHGRFGKPCPVCGAPVQRIVYVENECNYCPRCQTGGRILADRALSRLLREDWPRSLDEL